MYFDVSKHIYDVRVMMGLDQIQRLLEDTELFRQMLGYKRLEETRRTGSDLTDRKYQDFKMLAGFADNEALQAAYLTMQKNYVFKEQDVLPFVYVIEQWGKQGDRLKALD